MTALTPSPISNNRRGTGRHFPLCDLLVLLILAVIPALLTGWLHPRHPVWSWTKPAVVEVDMIEAARWPEPILWIDARSASAYEKQHVPGAILLNEDDWEKLLPHFIERWPPTARIIVYCDSTACDASQAVAQRLQREIALTEIHVLKGGWPAWQKKHP